jgi:hypothetical protein
MGAAPQVAAAGGEGVAGAAGDAVVGRQLLFPEQQLAEDRLRRGDRVLGRDGLRWQGLRGHRCSEQDERS